MSETFNAKTVEQILKVTQARAEAAEAEVERLKRMLSPYADDKEISGLSWNGFYLIGNRKSIDELRRIENRAAQLEVYRVEFVRRNEAAEAEVGRLKGVLEEIKRLSRLEDGVRMSAINQLADKALEAKP